MTLKKSLSLPDSDIFFKGNCESLFSAVLGLCRGAQASPVVASGLRLLLSMWDFSSPGQNETASPALENGFSTSGPSGKSPDSEIFLSAFALLSDYKIPF